MFSFFNKFLWLSFVIVLFACQQADKELNVGIEVLDDTGARIVLAKPAKRVIALAPHIVENIYSAGAGDLLLARVDYSDYPSDALKLPSVGGHNTFNIEAIAAMQPDIIFAWQSGMPIHFLKKIKELGIPVYVDEPTTIEGVATAIRNIGRLTGREQQAEKSAAEHLAALDKLRKGQIGKAKLKVFYQVWDDPLYTINGEQIISDVIDLCGGINIFADETIKAPVVNVEALIELDPEVIMTGDRHRTAEMALSRWKAWPNLVAVKQNNLFVVNPDIVIRHTRRIIDGAISVCDKLDQARAKL